MKTYNLSKVKPLSSVPIPFFFHPSIHILNLTQNRRNRRRLSPTQIGLVAARPALPLPAPTHFVTCTFARRPPARHFCLDRYRLPHYLDRPRARLAVKGALLRTISYSRKVLSRSTLTK